MAQGTELAVGHVVAGRYQVERLLGRGAMGVVYAVRHAVTGERFALKVLDAGVARDAKALSRFRIEARAPAQIQSEHVVRVIDADIAPDAGGAPFIVMDLLRGRDIAQEIEARGALPSREVVGLLRQAAVALDKAHALGIVHRDLKPENLFLAARPDGSVALKILDFGLAKLAEGSSDGIEAPSTTTGNVLGTPLYMAPEQARGQVHAIGAWTDVWAIGILAYKLLTGRDYFALGTVAELIVRITYEPMRPPSLEAPLLGPAFDEWFARCCAREPSHRFRSVGEAVVALAVALRVSPSAEEQAPTERQPQAEETHALPKVNRDDDALAFESTELVVLEGPSLATARAAWVDDAAATTVLPPVGPHGTERIRPSAPPRAAIARPAPSPFAATVYADASPVAPPPPVTIRIAPEPVAVTPRPSRIARVAAILVLVLGVAALAWTLVRRARTHAGNHRPPTLEPHR